jgi:hypothetical protein
MLQPIRKFIDLLSSVRGHIHIFAQSHILNYSLHCPGISGIPSSVPQIVQESARLECYEVFTIYYSRQFDSMQIVQ